MTDGTIIPGDVAGDGSAYSPLRPDPGPHYTGVRDRGLERPPGVPAMHPDKCLHEHMSIRADVIRLVPNGSDTNDPTVPPDGFDLEIAVDCLACFTPFEYVGLPVGLSPAHPTVSMDGTTMTAPLRPLGAPPGFGLNRPGYSVTYYASLEEEEPPNDHR